jgi:hypothetical protein
LVKKIREITTLKIFWRIRKEEEESKYGINQHNDSKIYQITGNVNNINTSVASLNDSIAVKTNMILIHKIKKMQTKAQNRLYYAFLR